MTRPDFRIQLFKADIRRLYGTCLLGIPAEPIGKDQMFVARV